MGPAVTVAEALARGRAQAAVASAVAGDAAAAQGADGMTGGVAAGETPDQGAEKESDTAQDEGSGRVPMKAGAGASSGCSTTDGSELPAAAADVQVSMEEGDTSEVARSTDEVGDDGNSHEG